MMLECADIANQLYIDIYRYIEREGGRERGREGGSE